MDGKFSKSDRDGKTSTSGQEEEHAENVDKPISGKFLACGVLAPTEPETGKPPAPQQHMTVKEELFRAADELIANLNKQGVTQGRTDIAEPGRHHPSNLITMEEYEDYLALAESYAIDKRLKRPKEQKHRFVGKKIDVAHILKDVTTRDGRLEKCMHVLFSGAAGMGKTTLLRRIAQDGRQGKIEALKDKLILMPDFRTFASGEKILPSQALLGNMFSDYESERMGQRYQWIKENSKDVVFMVDSLDTLPFDLENERPHIGHGEKAPIDDIVHNLFSRDLFPKSIIISSSREYKVRNLHPSVRPDRFVLLDGLNAESIDELIDDFLGKEKGFDIKKHIATKCPAIRPLLTIPVFLVFFSIGCVSGVFTPETMSGILATYFITLTNSSHVNVKTFQVVLKKLLPMAFEGTRKGVILFTPEHMKRFGITPEEVSALGILIPQSQGTYLTSKLMQDDRFFLYFKHLTQQEFLAALSILSLSTDKFEEFIMTYFNESNFIVVRRFVYGVLLNDEVLEGAKKLTKIPDVQRKRSILLNNLKASFNAIDNDDNAKLLEFFIDLNECKNGMTTELIRSLVQKIYFKNINLSPSDIQAVASLMKQCIYLEKVDLYNCNLNGKKMEILWETLVHSNLKLNVLFVSSNLEIGPKGMKLVGKLTKNHEVKILRAWKCSLTSEHIEYFAEGLGDATLDKLYIGSNPELGPNGMNLVGKLTRNHGIKVLGANKCNMKSTHVENFAEGLKDAMIDSLYLDDWQYKPPYTRSVLKLLLHVRKVLNLEEWKINERQQEEIRNELNKIGSPTLNVIVGDSPPYIHLKASQVESTTGMTEEPSSSGAISKPSCRSDIESSLGAVSIVKDKAKKVTAGEIFAEMDRRIKTKSTKRTVVGRQGGSVEIFGCQITFPPQAYVEDTEFQTSVITDLSDCPKGKIPIAPIIECGPPGRLNRPAHLEIEHWAFPARGDIYAEVFRKDNEEFDWKFVEKVHVVLHQPISFYTKHFTLYQFVVDRATSFLSRIRQYFFRYTLQNLVYISGVDQSLACVCCLKNSKVMDDVTQTLKNAHYQPLLPAPETTFGERGEDVKITIQCREPDNLTIRVGEDPAVRRIEKMFPVSTIAAKCKEFYYLPIRLADGDLKQFDGVLSFGYSHTAGEDNVQHSLQKVWPIPGAGPSHISNTVNTYGNIQTETIMGADPNGQLNQLVRH